MVGTNDLNKSIIYYDTLLDLLNLKRVDTSEEYAGYAPKNNPDNIEFYVTKPANKKGANFGNGTQISFIANTKEIVDKFGNGRETDVVWIGSHVEKGIKEIVDMQNLRREYSV